METVFLLVDDLDSFFTKKVESPTREFAQPHLLASPPASVLCDLPPPDPRDDPPSGHVRPWAVFSCW